MNPAKGLSDGLRRRADGRFRFGESFQTLKKPFRENPMISLDIDVFCVVAGGPVER
jgi:hypothetical protein